MLICFACLNCSHSWLWLRTIYIYFLCLRQNGRFSNEFPSHEGETVCAKCLCKMHDVPKRTEDIFILCINFYPAVEIQATLCAPPKTHSTLHDVDYALCVLCNASLYEILYNHTHQLSIKHNNNSSSSNGSGSSERVWAFLPSNVCRCLNEYQIERPIDIYFHAQHTAHTEPILLSIPLRIFAGPTTLTNCAFDFSFLSFRLLRSFRHANSSIALDGVLVCKKTCCARFYHRQHFSCRRRRCCYCCWCYSCYGIILQRAPKDEKRLASSMRCAMHLNSDTIFSYSCAGVVIAAAAAAASVVIVDDDGAFGGAVADTSVATVIFFSSFAIVCVENLIVAWWYLR